MFLRYRGVILISAIVISCSLIAHLFWPYRIVGAGYVFVQSQGGFDYIKYEVENLDWYQDSGGSSAVMSTRGGYRHLFHDGYSSLDFDSRGIEVTSETLIGASVASLLPKEKTNNLLVLGFGTGISTGTASRLFDEVDVYETRGSMVDIAEAEFSAENHNVIHADNVNINIQDGIVGTAISKDSEYDAVLINVPSPGIRGAEKIYSVEFYELVASKLKNHGLVFTWISAGLGYEVLQVILNNFKEAYGESCRYFLLDRNYGQIICAPHMEPEEFRNISPRNIGVTSTKGYDLGYLTRISEVEKVSEPEISMTGKLHTLDHPWFDTRALFESIFVNGFTFDRIFSLIHQEEYERYERFEFSEKNWDGSQ